MSKPAIAKGTRDFLPSEVIKRNYIFDHIKEVFKTYGYLPIETPAIELLQTLTGKYGDEGDKLLFKILNNGDYLAKANPAALAKKDSNAMLSSISRRGLRYDLTVPLARYVSMHQNDIQFPFKRYAIQPVWRADRPQKGRYQEFYQCDADVVGSDSLMYEAELLQVLDTVYARLDLDVIIKLNNRKILQGIAEVTGQSDNFIGVTVAIDKLDKIGRDKVAIELTNLGMDDNAASTILDLIQLHDINLIATKLSDSETGMLGVSEMKEVMDYMSDYTLKNKIEFDFTLARGLSYYTGCIIEVVADTATYPDLKMGSLSGGGRYADLTSMFGLKDMSGVGVSFGAERIYDVMEECNLFPESVTKSIDIFFVSFDTESHRYACRQVSALRAAGISADIYPENTKMKKQMKYANGTAAPYVAIIGSDEVEAGVIAVKEMVTGDQVNFSLAQLIEKLKA
ncbi:histidine--tRNA ligase [uncultured Dokdonia sp.]|uniref:histidine--tRNA ligase n=1 Tax=uncultured Dokdonia sp. TaxID=575653 RepID=UPI00262601A9|nr:histidine--tRNA ligase [uncultured Dokdonia sp.]